MSLELPVAGWDSVRRSKGWFSWPLVVLLLTASGQFLIRDVFVNGEARAKKAWANYPV